MKFSNNEFQVLQLGWINLLQECRLGSNWLGGCSSGKDLEGSRLDMSQQDTLAAGKAGGPRPALAGAWSGVGDSGGSTGWLSPDPTCSVGPSSELP